MKSTLRDVEVKELENSDKLQVSTMNPANHNNNIAQSVSEIICKYCTKTRTLTKTEWITTGKKNQQVQQNYMPETSPPCRFCHKTIHTTDGFSFQAR